VGGVGDAREGSPEGRGLISYSTSWGDDVGCVVAVVAVFAFTSPSHSLLYGELAPRDLRTAHRRGRWISYAAVDSPRATTGSSPLFFLGRISLRDGWRCHENKIK
jgi:hypothetical protein